jgi:hypothetical protein
MTITVTFAASPAMVFIKRNISAFKECFTVFFIFFADIKRAVEAIFPAGGCKVSVIHIISLKMIK